MEEPRTGYDWNTWYPNLVGAIAHTCIAAAQRPTEGPAKGKDAEGLGAFLGRSLASRIVVLAA